MIGRVEDVFRLGRETLRGGYPPLATAVACGLLVLLLWPQPPRTYQAEATAAATMHLEPLPAASDAISWLKSDEVLRAAVTNLRNNQPRTLGAVLGDDNSGDPVDVLRKALQVAPLASPDELPRLAIGCRAARPRAALAIADELARELAEHFGAQQRHDRKARFEEKERQVKQELGEAQSAQERLEIQLENLRHAQLTAALAAQAPQPADSQPAEEPKNPLAELQKSIASLKVERDRLLEVYLPAHPQIRSLIAQITHLEDSLRKSAPEGEEGEAAQPPQTHNPAGGKQTLLNWQRDHDSSAAPAAEKVKAAPPAAGALASELTAAIQKAQLDLLAAAQRRQEAEQKSQVLAAERSELEAAGNVGWTIHAARLIDARSSSRSHPQLAAAFVASVSGGLGLAWLMRLAARDRPLTTTAELSMAISVPILGTLASSDDESIQPPVTTRAQWGVNLITRCAEVIALTFVLTLLAAAALDRGLLSDLMLDPLATLGDLLGRLV